MGACSKFYKVGVRGTAATSRNRDGYFVTALGSQPTFFVPSKTLPDFNAFHQVAGIFWDQQFHVTGHALCGFYGRRTDLRFRDIA